PISITTSLPTVSSYIFYIVFFFFFNYTATTEIYTLSLHDALPICRRSPGRVGCQRAGAVSRYIMDGLRHNVDHYGRADSGRLARSEEHTSELQSRGHLVCRLLLEKKKKKHHNI